MFSIKHHCASIEEHFRPEHLSKASLPCSLADAKRRNESSVARLDKDSEKSAAVCPVGVGARNTEKRASFSPASEASISSSLQPGQMGPPSRYHQRTPLVIKGSKQRRASQRQFSNRGRALVTMAATCLTLLISLAAFATIVSVDEQGHSALSSLLDKDGINLMPGKANNAITIPSEMATRAVEIDGYDPFAHVDAPPPILADGSTISRFYDGQCTYWANLRYHELTGFWVPWLGDAFQWYYQAAAYHWHVSDRPNPNGPSILVLGPYSQNSSNTLGHVAVVEKDLGNGTVLTSNMHWPILGAVSYVTFHYPVANTHFIWAT